MKITFALLGLAASVQACLTLSGTYYTVNNQLIVLLNDNGNQVCQYVGTATTALIDLACQDGHYAWILQPHSPNRLGWSAAYAHDGQDYHFGVDASIIYSSGANRAVGVELVAANYGC